MPKASIFTDIHICSHKGSVERLTHCLTVLDWVFETSYKEKVDYLFFLGDLFHEKDKIDVLAYLRTFEIFQKYMTQHAPFETYLLLGNHDLYLKNSWLINSVKPLSAIPKCTVIDKPTTINFQGINVDWMPYTENPLRDLDQLKESSDGHLLLGHLAIDGAMLNIFYGTKSDVIVEYDNDMIAVDKHVFSFWKKVKLGHYHSWQILDNIEYIGSPLQLTYGEAFQQKHLQILDLETLESKYVINDFSPKHFIINANEIDNYNFDNSFVRLSIDNLGSRDIIDLKQKITKNYNVLSFDTKKKDKNVEEDKTFIDGAKTILLNIRQMLETYVQERNIPEGMDKNKLLKIGEKCLEKKI